MMTSVLTGIRETGLFEEIGGCSVLRTAGDAEGEYRALREGAMFYDSVHTASAKWKAKALTDCWKSSLRKIYSI